MKDDDTPETKAPDRIETLDQTDPEQPSEPATSLKPDPLAPPPGDPIPTATDQAPAPEVPAEKPATPEPRPQPAPPQPPVQPPVQPVVQRRGGFLPALLGGALAAIGGFALSHYDVLDLRPQDDATALETRLATLEAGLNDGLTAVRAESAAKAEAAEAIATRAADAVAPVEAGLSALSGRIESLEKALAAAGTSTEGGAPAAALAALSAEVEALKSRPQSADPAETRAIVAEALTAWEADATARAAAEAEAAKQRALGEAARQALAQAVDTGAPYRSALTALGASDVPEALEKFADSGLPTLAALQDGFAAAARAALTASLKAGESGDDGLWSFLRVQTGARSLSPQEGNDPDAILSRAEAALKAGQLDQALAEIAALPPAGQTAMAEWTAAARTRAEAAKALAPLVAAPNPAP